MCDVPKESKVLIRTSRVRADGLIGYLLELVCREVRGVGDGAQAGNEGRLDVADGLPVHAVKEGMVLDLFDSQAAVRRGDQPADAIVARMLRTRCSGTREMKQCCSQLGARDAVHEAVNAPLDQILCLAAEVDVIGELQVVVPL